MKYEDKLYFIVTQDCYIGHNPFDDEKEMSSMDIQMICDSYEDALRYIDETLILNMSSYEKSYGKGVIEMEIKIPEFFKGLEVDVFFTDTSKEENNKWLWVFSIYERHMYVPENKEDLTYLHNIRKGLAE